MSMYFITLLFTLFRRERGRGRVSYVSQLSEMTNNANLHVTRTSIEL